LVAIQALFVNLSVVDVNICHLDVQDGMLLVHDVTPSDHCACSVTLADGVYISHALHIRDPPVAAVCHQSNVFHAFVGSAGSVTDGCTP
jgi:hypothetical protein